MTESVSLTEVRYLNVTPGAAMRALDGDRNTAWALQPGEIAANFSAEFHRRRTVSDPCCQILATNEIPHLSEWLECCGYK